MFHRPTASIRFRRRCIVFRFLRNLGLCREREALVLFCNRQVAVSEPPNATYRTRLRESFKTGRFKAFVRNAGVVDYWRAKA